jgi:hypothetical protein
VGVSGIFLGVGVVAAAGMFIPQPTEDTLLLGGALVATFAVLGFAVTYSLQIAGFLSRGMRVRIGICSRRFRLTTEGKFDACRCGGTFEDADGWTLNRCPKCNYDLRGSSTGCPECGADLGPPSGELS